MFNNCDPKHNGEHRFFESIKNSIRVIFDVGCRFESEFLNFEGEVHYFDPVNDFVEKLELCPNRNRIARFNSHGLGAENKESYYYPKYQSFIDRIASCTVSDDANKVMLKIRRADDYIAENKVGDNNVGKVDFLKIDTEGFEFDVLKGFGKALRDVQFIQFEYGGTFMDNGVKMIDVVRYLEDMGFTKFSYLTKDGPILISSFNDHYQYCNIVCVNEHSPHASTFPSIQTTKKKAEDETHQMATKNFYVYTTAGFGNVLFMLMNGYALARKNGGSLFAINSSNPAGRPHIGQYHLFRNFPRQDPQRGFSQYNEPHFKYAEPNVSQPTDYVLGGYYQSWKYTTERDIEELKEMMMRKSPIIEMWRSEFQDILKRSGKKKALLVHVRRTDYIGAHECHPVQPQAYYEKALEELHSDDHLIIASSDDTPYLKQWELLKKYDHYIVEEGIEKSWVWMTMCDDFIIANSSMSLGAYYFRDNKDARLRAPSTWFGPKGPQFDIEEIVKLQSGDVKVTTPETEQAKIIYISPYDYPPPKAL